MVIIKIKVRRKFKMVIEYKPVDNTIYSTFKLRNAYEKYISVVYVCLSMALLAWKIVNASILD